MTDLSAYELSRAENIRRNNAYLLALGLHVAAEDVRKPKPKPKPKAPPKPQTEAVNQRRSSRLDGIPVEELEVVETKWEADEKAPKRGEAGLNCWWLHDDDDPLGPLRPPLSRCQEYALLTPLTAEQRDSLVLEGHADEWITDMLRFLRAYGAQRPEPFCVPSHANFKKVIDTLSVLASGDGVTCAYRGGTFDAGVQYTPKHDLDEALKRALQWLPKAKDKSNGWTFTHPFEKMKQYQRALFWKHLFPLLWEGAQPTKEAAAVANAMATSKEGQEDACVWRAMATCEPVVAVPQRVVAAAAEQTVTPTAAQTPTEAEPVPKVTRAAVLEIVRGHDVATLTGKDVREMLEAQQGLPRGALKPFKEEIMREIDSCMEELEQHPEEKAKRQRV